MRSSRSPWTATRPRCSRPSRRRGTRPTPRHSFSDLLAAVGAGHAGAAGLHRELQLELTLALVHDGGGALRLLPHHHAFLGPHHPAVLHAAGLAAHRAAAVVDGE